MPKRILAVDDEKNIRLLVRTNLEKAGYGVDEAIDGQQALDMIRADPPDLVVLDWMMPNLNGMELLKELQADPRFQNIPVIMLTGKAQDADVFIGWASGVSAYLTKPFNPRELLVFIKRILEALEAEEQYGPWREQEFDDGGSGGIVYSLD